MLVYNNLKDDYKEKNMATPYYITITLTDGSAEEYIPSSAEMAAFSEFVFSQPDASVHIPARAILTLDDVEIGQHWTVNADSWREATKVVRESEDGDMEDSDTQWWE